MSNSLRLPSPFNGSLKVLHVIPAVSEKSGGPSQAIFPMCRALQAQGIELVLATTDHGLPLIHSPEFRESSSPRPQDYNGIPTIFFPSQCGGSFKYSRPLAAWLEDNVSRFDVVHIHAVFNHACIAAARACWKRDVPYIVRPLGTLDPWGMKQKSWRKALFWQVVGKEMLRKAAAVQYTALEEKEAAEQSLGLNHGHVVPLGVETETADPASTSRVFANQFSALQKHPYVLVLSRLLPTKGLDPLLEAFLSLVKQPAFHDWRLVLAGEGPGDYVADLKKEVDLHNAQELVLFPGWVGGAKKEALLAGASLLALPSEHENFGLCVMEALARSVPVLVSPHVNLARYIEEAGAGWVASANATELKTALADALRDDEIRKRAGSAGRSLSLQFSWGAISSELIKLYSSVSRSQPVDEPGNTQCLPNHI